MSRRRVFVNAPAGATLALWLAVAGVSFGFAAVPALAEESEATEAPAAELGQQPEAPAVAEGEAPEASGPEEEAVSSSPDRPRSRVVRPDPSDLDDRLWDSGPPSQEVLAAPGTEGIIACVAGCSEAPSNGGNAAERAAEPSTPATTVCVAGC